MTAPGWYNAEGDPPGSQRYWDGSQWVGDPVFEPGAPATAAAPQAFAGAPVGSAPGGYGYDGGHGINAFPSGLKTLTIIVSVLKAIGWAGLLILTIWIASFLDDANDFDDTFGGGTFDLGGAVGAAVGTLAVILIIGGALLFFQFRGAIKENASSLFVVALIMTILDGLVTLLMLLGAIGDGDGGSFIVVLVYIATFVAQLMITIKAKQAS